MSNILITGGAGFIGSHLSECLLKANNNVICLDNFNDFYSPKIKHQNIHRLLDNPNFILYENDIRDLDSLKNIFNKESIQIVIHLAAMAGVRPSILTPLQYFDVNVNGTLNILECLKNFPVKKLLFASSSSVYGNNTKIPFSEKDPVDHPISPYAASKKAGELICYNYHHLYNIPIACLRFFTVYGPRQRPEMAIHKFTRMIYQGNKIPVYNYGNCLRDYTYIDDIIRGIFNIMTSDFQYDVINLGESQTISTLELIKLIESNLNKKAKIQLLPSQPGDVEKTYANIDLAKEKYSYNPNSPIEKGIHKFVEWYKHHHY